ncbi:MAG: diaminopimelate epimerase [Candidatus Latescibacteria bacterium]|nr:diaminopimelate epimerase [Candidatus Latescibacterota bacterium]
MKFTKMHGLGNDHIIIDLFKENLPNPHEIAPRMCHRHLGGGADGLILIGPSEKYDFRMQVINSDGSEAEMCGNGIRCLARYVIESGLTDKTEFVTETLKGPHKQEAHLVKGKFADVTTSMGTPSLRRSQIPMTGEDSERVIGEELVVDGISYRINLVNVGNPHCVIFVDDVDAVDLKSIGPKFEHNPLFPNRINTEFVQLLDRNNLRMRVWERGSGETLACGTGATASVVAAILNGLVFDTVSVHLAYGDLFIEWKNHDELHMTGGAETVFTGEYKF